VEGKRMLDILSAVGLDANQFVALFAIATIVMILAYRPFVIGILDPLNVFIVAMIADVVLMFGLPWDSSAKIEFTFFIVFFWIGFAFVGKIPTDNPTIRFNNDSLLELEIVLLLDFVIVSLANLYLGFTEGFPLLSSEPSEAKVSTYTGGLGMIRHLDQGPYLFLCCGCILFIAIGRRPMLAMMMLVISSGFVALSGAKGALLPIIFVMAFVIKHKGLGQSQRYSGKLKKLAIPSLGAASAVAATVLVKENGGVTQGFAALARRILLFGDVILFYYPQRNAIPGLVNAGPWDYVHYLMDSYLAMFRIVDYSSIKPALGSMISNQTNGFGPNAQYFVRADIFFGPIAGCIYCLVIGYLTGLFRRQFFTFHTRSAVTFTFSLLFAVTAVNLPFETSLFSSYIVDATVFLFPLWCFAHVATLSTTTHRDLSRSIIRT
jgi:hypothetical protein